VRKNAEPAERRMRPIARCARKGSHGEPLSVGRNTNHKHVRGMPLKPAPSLKYRTHPAATTVARLMVGKTSAGRHRRGLRSDLGGLEAKLWTTVGILRTAQRQGPEAFATVVQQVHSVFPGGLRICQAGPGLRV